MLQRFTTLNFSPLGHKKALHRHKHVPDSSNHSLYLIKLLNSTSPERHCGGNQPPDDSTCHSPRRPKYNERFARKTFHDVRLKKPVTFHNGFMFFFLKHLLYKYTNICTCHHESSRTEQHWKWNCVGTNRPQHMHMYSHIVCD